MTIAIVAVFLAGYVLIALERSLHANKTAIALLMCVICWTLYILTCGNYVPVVHPEFTGDAESIKDYVIDTLFISHMGDTSEILFFLLGAMAVVEVVDANGGFKFVRDKLHDSSRRRLLWKIAFVTFFMSAVLDNMTSSIVMVMVLRKLIPHRRLRMRYDGMVIIAANLGGVFSPIGDVTTIMLWIRGMITAPGVIKELFMPAVIAMVAALLLAGRSMNGTLDKPEMGEAEPDTNSFSRYQRTAVFWVGVGGLVFVPIFRGLTGLPPFMGVLLAFGVLWLLTEIFYQNRRRRIKSFVTAKVEQLLSRIDLSTILFFLGILMAVAAVQETGALHRFGEFLDESTGSNVWIVNTIIGLASAVVDNVPLVASCMAMYEIDPASIIYQVDGEFWQLLAFCAGTGGSMLIIGSTAGVVVMGLERLSFGYYVKNFTAPALLSFFVGIAVYWVERAFIF